MGRWMQSLVLAVSVFSCLPEIGSAAAVPDLTSFDDDALFDSSHVFADFGTQISKRQDRTPLRIMSLGASIMSGVGSSSGNGYDLSLQPSLFY